jgi:hypothetical protein
LVVYFNNRVKMREMGKMAKKWTTILVAVIMSLGLAFFVGCESEAQKDAGVGALAGAGVGAIVGHQSGKTTEGALIGGAVGGGAGYIVGNEQDKKKTKAEMDDLRQETNTVTVNVANSNGSVTPVTLKKQGAGYVGPRGEFYNTLPTSEQLKPIYGF